MEIKKASKEIKYLEAHLRMWKTYALETAEYWWKKLNET